MAAAGTDAAQRHRITGFHTGIAVGTGDTGTCGHGDIAAGQQIHALARTTGCDTRVLQQIPSGIQTDVAAGARYRGIQHQIRLGATCLQQQIASRLNTTVIVVTIADSNGSCRSLENQVASAYKITLNRIVTAAYRAITQNKAGNNIRHL